MRSATNGLMPPKLRRSLAKLGADVAIARRKRSFTVQMMAERVGVAKTTYIKVEKGDPSVSMGVYAMTLFVLGLANALGEIADVRHDDTGLVLDEARMPKRIRPRKGPVSL